MNYGGKAISKRCDFRRFLKELIKGADRMSSGRAFQIAGASKARPLLNCFFDLCTDGEKWGTSRNLFLYTTTTYIVFTAVRE